MSAFNITLALPQARGADATSGKSVDPDGGDEAGGNRFADMFRDIGREITDAGRSAAGTDATATDAAATTDATGGDTSLQTLADALASAGKSRTPAAAGDSAGRAANAGDAAASSDGTAANLLAQSGKPARAGTSAHAATRQTLAATAAQLLSAADAANAQAAQDQQDLAITEAAADATTTQISVDTATAEKAATQRRADDKSADTAARRLPGNQALTALLFGRTDADDTLTTTGHTVASKDGTAAETAAQDGSAQDAASADPALPNAAAGAQLAMPLQIPPAALASATAQTGGEPTATGRETLGGTAGTANTMAAAQPMRITILSRETHFAPIRTLGLNGASAPSAAGAATDTRLAAATDGSAAEQARTASADPRTATTAASARVLANAASSTAATRAATPVSGTTTPATGTAETEASSETDGTERITPRTPARETDRSGDTRQAGRSREAEAGSARTGSKDAGATRTEGTGDAAASAVAEEAPVTGVAAIGGSSQPAAPAPALATLRQIGAAIAAEAGTMGATASVAGPTANLIAGPVRLLDIQLSPDDLGTVNVRMRLSNNGLEIRLRASNPETAKMLERDQSALLDLLAASGITADSITIVGGDGAGLAQLTGQDAGRPFTDQQPAAGDTETPRDQSGRDQNGRSPEDDRQKGQSRDDQARSPGRAFDLGGGFRV